MPWLLSHAASDFRMKTELMRAFITSVGVYSTIVGCAGHCVTLSPDCISQMQPSFSGEASYVPGALS